jgi:hypothetical protein
MADNVTVTNKKTSFDANTNADIVTRSVDKSSKQTQVVIVDYGGAGAESLSVPDFATQTTLSALNGKVTAVNTGAVVISSSALPTGAATESTLSTLNGKVTACNTGAVTISAALPVGSNTIGNVAVNKTALTPSSPTSASVGVASASALAANASRKGLVLTNLSVNNISFGLGTTAVLNSGITLTPNGTWVMDEYTFCTSQIFAIAGGASSTLAIQEFA